MRRLAILAVAILAVATASAQPRVTSLPEKPSSQLAPEIASAMQPAGVKAVVRDAILEI